MNVAALMLCTVALGADARETIPTSQKLYDLFDRHYQLHEAENLSVEENGALLKATGQPGNSNIGSQIPYRVAEHRRMMLIDKYRLRVVPCPGRPSCFLAGYVRDDMHEDPATRRQLNEWGVRIPYALLIDTDLNAVVPIDEQEERVDLTDAEKSVIKNALTAIWKNYLNQIDGQEEGAPFVRPFRSFQAQFVVPPPIEATVDAKLGSVERQGETFTTGQSYVFARFSAAEREVTMKGRATVRDLLATTIAVDAATFFGPEPK